MLLYKFYNFYEKSVQGEKIVVDNDISGEQYKDLMKTCCKYCKILSLKYRKNVFNTTREKLKKFESVNGPLGRPFIEYYSRGEETVFYDVCEELLFCLLSLADNIFCDWIDGWRANGPDDPTFYREDGTVFLNTITHEGELTLRPRENEDVSHIISNIGWLTHDNDPRSYRAEFRVNYVPNITTHLPISLSKKVSKCFSSLFLYGNFMFLKISFATAVAVFSFGT